jgi:hypothetical protein
VERPPEPTRERQGSAGRSAFHPKRGDAFDSERPHNRVMRELRLYHPSQGSWPRLDALAGAARCVRSAGTRTGVKDHSEPRRRRRSDRPRRQASPVSTSRLAMPEKVPASCASCCGPGSPSGRSYPTPSIHAAGRGDQGLAGHPGNPAFGIRYSGCGLPCPVQDVLLVLGLVLCFVAKDGGGSIVLTWKPAEDGGDMPSLDSSKCRVADRGGPVCCWRRWRGASSASLRFAW